MTAPQNAPEELRERQGRREAGERRRAADADTPEAELAARRRAEKARYLRERADEQVRADRKG